MKTKLIIINDNPIIVSDEEIKDGECCINIQNGVNENNIHYAIKEDCNTDATNCHKIIAGLDNLPEIDFNGLEEEFGIVDVENMVNKIDTPDHLDYFSFDRGFINGFKTAQSLNEKKYSLEEMKEAMLFAFDTFSEQLSRNEVEKCIGLYLNNSKVFDIEIEMEPVYLSILKEKVLGYKPKIINNKIKILKKL